MSARTVLTLPSIARQDGAGIIDATHGEPFGETNDTASIKHHWTAAGHAS